MADTYLRCEECTKTLKTFQALLKHYTERHGTKQLPKKAKFREGDQEIQPIVPQAIRSPVLQAEYKTWLVGVLERINGVHHQRHKRNWQSIEINMVPTKFFQQLLGDLDDPQPHAVRNVSHWRPPILKSCARKVTYRLFDLTILKDALEKQNILSLKEQVVWRGEIEDSESEDCIVDPRQAIAAAKSRAYGQGTQKRITCRSNLVIGCGEGRATRELDLIWWPNMYNTAGFGKLCIRLHVNRVDLV